MKNYHNDNKFCLVREIDPIRLCVDDGDYTYLLGDGYPVFFSKGKLYLALKFKLKYPYIFVDQSIPLPITPTIIRRFIV